MSEDNRYICTSCYFNHVETPRAQFLISRQLRLTCRPCGDSIAKKRKHTIVPMPKSNYIVVTDMSLLKGLNSSHKGGTT